MQPERSVRPSRVITSARTRRMELGIARAVGCRAWRPVHARRQLGFNNSQQAVRNVPGRKDNIDIIRGMALSAAAAMAEGDAVRTELTEDFANEQIKIRVHIGKRSAVFTVYNADVERVQGDRAVARKIEKLIGDALAEILA